MRGIAVSPYKNRIFMDCGISHIQHITRMGLRERGHVPRRFRDVLRFRTKHIATIGVKISPPIFDRNGSTKLKSRDTCYVSEFGVFVYSRCGGKLRVILGHSIFRRSQRNMNASPVSDHPPYSQNYGKSNWNAITRKLGFVAITA